MSLQSSTTIFLFYPSWVVRFWVDEFRLFNFFLLFPLLSSNFSFGLNRKSRFNQLAFLHFNIQVFRLIVRFQ